MTTTTATRIAAAHLLKGDVFGYHSTEVEVVAVSPLGTEHVEVKVRECGSDGMHRYLDYGVRETVEVTRRAAVEAPAPAPRKTATQRAREAVRLGKVRSLPASAALVLYALAAAQDEADDSVFVPSLGSVATGAGLAQSTTAGHLRALEQKGLVRGSRMGGWEVA